MGLDGRMRVWDASSLMSVKLREDLAATEDPCNLNDIVNEDLSSSRLGYLFPRSVLATPFASCGYKRSVASMISYEHIAS